MTVLIAIFLIIVGILATFRPDIVWTINESWKSNDATEPSDIYILTTRIGGILLLIVGVVGGTLYILLK
jgi:hypothetical protein